MFLFINRKISVAVITSLVLTVSGCKQENAFIPDSPLFLNQTYNSTLTQKITDRVNLVKKVVADTLTEIAPGVRQTTINYIDYSDKPMRLFIVEADLSNPNITIKAATPNNAPQFNKQLVTEIARRQDTVGSRVLVAINGDFFNVTTGEPQSILYKNGVAIKPLFKLCTLCTFLSVDQSGVPSIVSKERVPFIDSTKIQNAVGGFHWLVRDSVKVTQGDPSIEPRTAVGVSANKIVYFVVVDGRKTDYSNGMSFSQLSDVFIALGVKDAINLDGGGSSTLVVKQGTNFNVNNRPSDGVERVVANAITIVSRQ